MAIKTGEDLGLTVVRGHLIVVKEIAAFFRVSVRWVNKHMADGTFPFRWFPLGKRDRAIDSADLEDWLRSIAVEAGNAPIPANAIRAMQEVSA
jgi:predicted DNA-binding transcriptional regulator AlpA